jgi:hypothetical protein
MAYYICPNCHDRIIDADGRQGLSHQAVGCERCGFGFVFELLDDYYPRPESAMVACDHEGRVIAAGRGTFELTGYRELDLIGRPAASVLGLHGFAEGHDPVGTAREWGVRQLDEAAYIRHAAGRDKRVVLDVFPELNGEGGLLLVLAPRSA